VEIGSLGLNAKNERAIPVPTEDYDRVKIAALDLNAKNETAIPIPKEHGGFVENEAPDLDAMNKTENPIPTELFCWQDLLEYDDKVKKQTPVVETTKTELILPEKAIRQRSISGKGKCECTNDTFNFPPTKLTFLTESHQHQFLVKTRSVAEEGIISCLTMPWKFEHLVSNQRKKRVNGSINHTLAMSLRLKRQSKGVNHTSGILAMAGIHIPSFLTE
jgi:hypothetical protein